MNEQDNKATQVMDVAQELMQIRGYNAFSYADIAEQVGIRKASIHYYFPSKSDLAREVVMRYRVESRQRFAELDRQISDPQRKLELIAQNFGRTLHDHNRICLCGMLAAEMPTIPEEVRDEVLGYFTDTEEWLARVLAEGVKAGVLRVSGPIEVEARLIMVGLEGALMVARAFNDLDRLTSVAESLIERYIIAE
jgi:TetR/AcrR family transcriptional repressor of nem operon